MFNLCQIKVCSTVHGTIVHLMNLQTWNLYGKVEYISQTSENSFGTLPQNWTRLHSYDI